IGSLASGAGGADSPPTPEAKGGERLQAGTREKEKRRATTAFETWRSYCCRQTQTV
ncbi:DEAD/DEAH box helicase domain-containing protein, partial [Toxoplasma gondii RUB]